MAYHRPLPYPDLRSLWTQPSSPTYQSVHGTPQLESFAAASPNPNAHTPFDIYGWHPQTDNQPVPYHTPVVNPQDSGPMPIHGYSFPVSKRLLSRVCIARLWTHINCIGLERFFPYL